MPTTRRECDDEASTMSNLKRILRNAHCIFASSSTAKAVVIPPNPPQSLQTAFAEVRTPAKRAQKEDSFNVIADRLVSEGPPPRELGRATFALSTRLENAVCEQITSLSALVGNAVVRFIKDASPASETSQDTIVISVIQPVVSSTVEKPFQSAASFLAVEQAVHKSVSQSQTIEEVVTKVIHPSAFIISVAKLIKHVVEKNSLLMAR